MKRILLFISVLLYSFTMFAQHRSQQEAMRIAQQFWGLTEDGTSLKMESLSNMRQQIKRRGVQQDNQEIAKGYYIVNDETGNRFVVISSDERMHQVLGYSDKGTFDAATAPSGLLDMLAEYDSQHACLGTVSAKMKIARAKTTVEAISPLMKSDWGQQSPFNDRCPINVSLPDNQRSVSGCVATAMAQVMNYHKYPSQGHGAYSYVSKYGTALAMNYDTLRLDWNLIKDSYQQTSGTALERAEVAKLMLACGISVSMNYGQDEDNQSGAFSENLPYALINYFGYNPNILFKSKDYYSDEEWNEMIMKELKAGHPILYAGRMSTWYGGHQFVLDGCDADGRFHMNYGWNGSSDGYFYLSSSDRFMFPYYQDMVYQIAPEEYGEREDVFYASDFSVSRRNIPVGEKVKFSFYPQCYSFETTYREPGTNTFSGEVGVGLYDDDFNFIASLYSLPVKNLTINDGKSVNANITLDNSRFSDGNTYKIAPYAKSVNSTNPTRIRTSHGEHDYYQATVTDGSVRLLLKGQEFSDVLTGRYKATAVNMNGETEEWYVNLRRYSEDDDARYEILDIDPVAGKLTSSSSYNMNRISGTVNADGTQISCSTGTLGDNIKLTNYTGNKDIVLHLDSKNGIINIDDVWGCTMTEGNGSSASVKELSRYTNTRFSFVEAVDVESPAVEVSSDNVLTFKSADADAVIYYTLDGTTPTIYNAAIYNAPIPLLHNCTVKAMVFKNDNFSEVVTYKVNWFTVATPQIAVDDGNGIVTITTDTDNADIYYTTDETKPSANSTKYEGPFTCEKTCIVKAFAVKSDFNDSQVSTKLVAIGEDDRNMKIFDNMAGELATRIPEENRQELLALTISGQLNGTDIKLIRDMLQDGKLYVLNMKDASIVAGGEKYDGIYSTEDDVIGNGMFEYSKLLQTLILPSGVKSIKSFAFTDCANLHTLEIPALVESIDEYAFANNDGMEHINVVEENVHLKSEDGIVYSKDGSVIVLCPIKKNLTAYDIPEGVKEIASHAFRGTSIRTINYPSTLEKIGSSAFEDCALLQEAFLPESVSIVGSDAFSHCKNLEKMILSTAITSLEPRTFSYCVNLKEIQLGEKMKTISPYAFSNCSSLQEIAVNENNTTFCSVEGVVYSKDMKTLVICPRGLYAEQFIVPNGVEKIADRAFDNCLNIGSIYLPNSVTTIGEYGFADTNITGINIPETITTIGNYAFSSSEIELLVLPEGMTKLENSLAAYCYNLSYVLIPSTINSIGSRAFYGCENLSVINTKIKDIEAVDFYTSQWTPVSEAFNNIPSDCTWRIPMGPDTDEELYAKRYMAQPWWVETWKIILEPDETPTGIKEISNTPSSVSWNGNTLTITATDSGVLNVYSINGTTTRTVTLKKGEQHQIELPKGMYVVNGKKLFIK